MVVAAEVVAANVMVGLAVVGNEEAVFTVGSCRA